MYDDPRPSIAPLLRTGAALLCLLFGLIGLVLPLIPGIPFLIVGLLLLRRGGRRSTRFAPAARSAPVIRRGLSGFEQLELQFWLLARRVTTAAESIRLAHRRRVRQRDR